MRAQLSLALVCSWLAVACGGASAPSVREDPSPNASEPTGEDEAVSASEAEPGPPADAQKPAPVEFGSISAAIAGSQRSETNRARDRYRHPRETLEFFGVHPGQRVIELWPGAGWYTELLAPLLHDQGSLVAVAPDGGHGLDAYRTLLGSRPDVFGHVELVTVKPPDELELGAPESADVVLTFRNLHNWVMGGYAKAMHAAIFAVLKPGGVYGVVDHRAPQGSSPEQSARSGYVSEAAAIELAQQAGFVLEARSEINANPNDTKDYPEGVWTLPPVLRLGDKDRDKYLAIGESDRMTLRFRKPAPSGAPGATAGAQ